MSLSQHEGKNNGGVKRIHLIKKSLATFDPSLALKPVSQYSDNITTSENWVTVVPVPNTCSFQEDQNGDVYTYDVNFDLNRDRQEVTNQLDGLQPFQLLALIEDHHGNIRLLGSDENHVKLRFSQVKEPRLSSANVYRLTLSGQQPFPAAYYSGSYTGS